MQRLADEGLQSDVRFAEAFVRSRILRGHGLTRIRQDIRQKGIADELVGQTLERSRCGLDDLGSRGSAAKIWPTAGGRSARDSQAHALFTIPRF